MPESTPGAIQELSPRQVAELLRERRILLIDVREPSEYAVQRISEALLHPLSTFDAAALPPDQPRQVVFHCGSGKRSALAAQARLASGAPRATHMTGGMAAWTAQGLPVIEIDPATGKPVRR
jgi:rhodanese-related sulfurtransferase